MIVYDKEDYNSPYAVEFSDQGRNYYITVNYPGLAPLEVIGAIYRGENK